jgi:hypothetical protein
MKKLILVSCLAFFAVGIANAFAEDAKLDETKLNERANDQKLIRSIVRNKKKLKDAKDKEKVVDYSNPAVIRQMALTKYKTPTPENEADTVMNVTVPQTAMPLVRDDYRIPTAHYVYEFTSSSWVPKSYSNPSYTVNTSNYDSAPVPKLSFNVLTEASNLGPVLIRPKFGISYEQLTRSGQLPVDEQGISVTEKLNLYSLRAGAEITTPKEYYRLKPVFSLAALPSWEQANSSAFSNGISKYPLLVEATLGGTVRLTDKPVLGTQALSLEAGLEETQDIGDKSLGSTGIFAGLRADL